MRRSVHGIARCTLLARQLAAGTYHLTASYGGSVDFYGSATAVSTKLIVAKEATKTSLSLSATKVAFGHEQQETFSVSVKGAYPGATPRRTCKVMKSTTTLCVITLAKGKGSCKLAASALAARTYRVVANYVASTDFAGSSSSRKNLTVSS